DELGEIDRLLASFPRIVRTGGVAAVISFHSLEDRRAKHAFQDRTTWEALTKKPQIATDAEREANPRAGSAKLRASRRRADP
ncbi:MAG TPA: 16S rRNA (cytosine(1402)-N(4))-methyltransferase, partial [Polyangiaceae bacterium]|nr:16S rRNA (cytosine(1402)-N(4))-methyltransferase [Polyangiaceae bacterium]